MNLVFASDSIWNWEAEKNFAILKEENPDLVQAARRSSSVIDPETGLPMPAPRRGSNATKGRQSSFGLRTKSEASTTTNGNGEKAVIEQR